MNYRVLNALYESDELYHYGVIGMKWGVRRYQPYGEGGYDPEHKGKFIGKKQAKQNAKNLRNVGKMFSKKDSRFKLYKEARNTDVAKKYLQSEEYKKELEKYVNTRDKREKLSSKVEHIENVLWEKPDEKLVKALSKAIDENDTQYKKLTRIGEDYAESMLGEYGNKKVKNTYGDLTVKKLLSGALNPIHDGTVFK